MNPYVLPPKSKLFLLADDGVARRHGRRGSEGSWCNVWGMMHLWRPVTRTRVWERQRQQERLASAGPGTACFLVSLQAASNRAFWTTIPAHATRGHRRIDSQLWLICPTPSLRTPLLVKERSRTKPEGPRNRVGKDSGPPLKYQGYCRTLNESFHSGDSILISVK